MLTSRSVTLDLRALVLGLGLAYITGFMITYSAFISLFSFRNHLDVAVGRVFDGLFAHELSRPALVSRAGGEVDVRQTVAEGVQAAAGRRQRKSEDAAPADEFGSLAVKSGKHPALRDSITYTLAFSTNNPQTKFEAPSFTRSKDTTRYPKCRKRSRDHDHAQCWVVGHPEANTSCGRFA